MCVVNMKGHREMKTLAILTLIAIGSAAAVAPAYARTQCATYQGQMVCCTTTGSMTTCF